MKLLLVIAVTGKNNAFKYHLRFLFLFFLTLGRRGFFILELLKFHSKIPVLGIGIISHVIYQINGVVVFIICLAALEREFKSLIFILE